MAKAKDVRPFFERLVTLAVKVRRADAAKDKAAALRTRRVILRLMGDRAIIPTDHRSAYEDMSDALRAKSLRMPSGRRHRSGEPRGRLAFTAESVTHRLINTIGPRFEDRPGGYTRLIRLPDRRLGDKTPLAMVQLIGDEEVPKALTKPRKSARKRRADARYARAAKVAKGWAKRDQPATSEPAEQTNADPGETGGEESPTE